VQYRYDPDLARRTSRQYRAMVPYTLNPSSYTPERNLLFRNDGSRFKEIGRQAGVDNPAGRSLSASWSDLDGDGRPDLYVANDISDNVFYRNLGGGRFQDISHAAWVADYRGAMGLAIGDWDNDADLDMFITHWIAQENALYDNLGAAGAAAARPGPAQAGGPAKNGSGLRFLDIADQVGLGQSTLDFVGWGTDFLDYDNDGRLDLFAVNGSTFQRDDDPSLLVPMRNQLFWNGGRERGFFDVGTAAGAALGLENVGRGGAFADYDADGDVDIVVVVNGGEARLLRNEGGNTGAWLRLVLRGRTNRFATGAVVRITAAGVTQMREVGSGPSYLSQSPPGETHIGLGSATTIDRLEIVWPSGTRQSFTGLPVRATVTVAEGREPAIAP
jgi:enediyne biosynthesis protein E4